MGFDEFLGLLPGPSYGVEGNPGLNLFALELLFWLAVAVVTIALVRFQPALLEKSENRLRRISRYKRFWTAGFGLAVIVVRLALLPLIPVPIPTIHDEFSYLLASDTFSHGRLTNPSSPMWTHFESFHINVWPSYQSIYPPAQGLALALGQTLTGVPWTGVLLSTALMCAAIYWMLLGWLSAPWAWLGGAFACVRFGIFSYWMNSYWGGSVAALGGALVLGALPRLRDKPTARVGLILAAGLLILANSRPLEGFLFSLPILVAVTVILIEKGKTDWRRMMKTALPAVLVLAVGAGGMLYYNWRGTGNALVMPYVINLNAYHISRPFLFQAPKPVPHYRHQSMRTFYVNQELPSLLTAKYALGRIIGFRASAYYGFYLWPFVLLIAPGTLAIWRSKARVVLFSVGLLIAELLPQIWPAQEHYAAPAVGAVFLIVLFSLRHFRNSNANYAVWGSRAVAMVLAVWMISPIAESLWDPYNIGPPLRPGATATAQAFPMPSQVQRQQIEATLKARGGKHLVIVHYPVWDDPGVDWIYNDADLDKSSVIWARDMGYGANEELLNYYQGRQIWYVVHGDPIAVLSPYERDADPLKIALAHSPSEMAASSTATALRQHASPVANPSPSATPQVSATLSP